MPQILIVYGTTYGQTERVVQRIAQTLSGAGHEVTLHRGDRVPAFLALDEFDGFLVAASVLYGRHQKYVGAFVRRHVARLNAAPSAFVSVSGSAASGDPKAQAGVQATIDRFLRDTGWRPRVTRAFGGAMTYSRYGWLLRQIIRLISRRNGGPTDTKRDYDMTDWGAVDRFAHELAKLWAPAARGERVTARL